MKKEESQAEEKNLSAEKAPEGENPGLSISAKSFISALVILLVLMIVTYVLTLIIPAGQYPRITDESGHSLIDATGEYVLCEGGLSFWKWLLSPFLVLGASGGATIIAVIIFLLVIGGIFNALEKGGIMRYLLNKLVHTYRDKRYRLMDVIILFFMLMGSLVGSYEECVPLVPIVVALAVSMGWDVLTGLFMSLLAVGCGFAAGICNPFTVGVAQSLAGLPMFSGMGYRVVGFVLIYGLLLAYTLWHAKAFEKAGGLVQAGLTGRGDSEPKPGTSRTVSDFTKDPKLEKAVRAFVLILAAGIVLILTSTFIHALQDYTMIIVAVMFLAAGITSTLASGMSAKQLGKDFVQGVTAILPAVLMILMASSIKYCMEEARILDTILHTAIGLMDTMPRGLIILFIYLIALLFNFFIASGSAKAFLLIPLIAPMAQVFGISSQLTVMAYAFGDGFSNVFYVTNPVLLISLGLAGISYGKWVKYSWKFQLANLALTSALLLLGLAIGY